MKRAVVLVMCGLLGGTGLGAQQAAAADFSPLEFLVGNCWVGTFADGKTTDEHCFEWKYGRKFIRDHHVVRGADGSNVYEGETLYGWNPATKEISWRYVSVEGLNDRRHRETTGRRHSVPGTPADRQGHPGDDGRVDSAC